MVNLKEVSNEELLQMYSNAKVTSGCGGHFKGERNDWLQEQYAMELRERGIYVPKSISEMFDKEFERNVDIPKGVFNGVGSY